MPILTNARTTFGPLVAALILPAILTGCPKGSEDDDIGDAGDTGSESGTDTGTDSETGTADQGTDTVGGTDTGTETDTGPDTATDTGTDSTTGEPDPEVEMLCQQACDVLSNCQQPVPGCLEECIDYHGGFADDPVCLDAEKALTACIGGLDCAQLEHFMNGDPEPYPCQDEEAATCDQGGECVVGVGESPNPDECSMSIECIGEPALEVDCTADGCTCFEDGVELTTCQLQQEICSQLDENLIYDCCYG